MLFSRPLLSVVRSPQTTVYCFCVILETNKSNNCKPGAACLSEALDNKYKAE